MVLFDSNRKNKRISKGRKGGKKKAVDPFSKKDWYGVKAPASFTHRNVGKTLVSRTQGTKIRIWANRQWKDVYNERNY